MPGERTMLRKSFLHIIFLIGVMTLLVSGQATHVSAGVNQWTSIGPTGGPISALVIDPLMPSILYAGTGYAGIFKSVNGGQSWSQVNIGLVDTTITALAVAPIAPATLYAGTGWGLFKSTNSADNWVETSPDLTVTSIDSIVIDPTMPSTLYVGTDDGVFKSKDGGDSWSAVSDDYVNALAIDSLDTSILYAGTWFGELL